MRQPETNPRGSGSVECHSKRWMLDPLEDGMDDETIVLTRREIVRITLVATEVGARFQRDGIRDDPMAWLLVPRTAFGNRPPIEACTSRNDCARAVLIHGLGLDLDISSEAIERLMVASEATSAGRLVPTG